MYRPSLRPGEELIKTSPGVNVKNVSFDAFLTSKRIIFVKVSDSFNEKKELVFPLNLVREFKPSSDESGTPLIRFSIEKPSGEVGDLIMKFIQTGDYRYAERDDWVEDLKSLSQGFVPRHGTEIAGGQKGRPDSFPGDMSPARNETIPAHGRDEELFGAGLRQSGVPSPQGFPQPTPSSQTAPKNSDPENRFSMPQGFSESPQAPSPPPVSGQQIQFCRFCGAKIPSGSAFCPSCGGKLEEQAEINRQPFTPQLSQSPPNRYQPFSPPPPPSGNQGMSGHEFVTPPPPTSASSRGGYSRHEGGISLADDRAYTSNSGSQISPKTQKVMMKNQAKAEKARMKQQARAEKERRKAMKKSQKEGYGGYNDPYGYKESRMPEPKILIMIVAVIAVIAVAGYAFTSGMIGGGGGTTTPPAGGSQPSPGTTTNEPGSTTVSTSFGNWFFEVLYSGEWSGTYTYNGQTFSISGFGYKKSPNIVDPSGTISINVHKDDDVGGKIMDITLYDAKSRPVESVTSSTDPGETVTVEYTVS